MARYRASVLIGLAPNLYPYEYDSYLSSRSATERRKKPSGRELLFSPTSVSNEVMRQSYGRYGGLWYPPDGMNWFIAHARASATEPAMPDLRNQIRSQIKNQKLNAAQFLAEFPSTARMFSDFAMRVVRARRALLRGDPRDVLSALSGSRLTGKERRRQGSWKGSALNTSGALANNQLAFTYGVKPLISDMNGAMAELLGNARSRPFLFPVTVRGNSQTAGNSVIRNDGAWSISADSVNQFYWLRNVRIKIYVEMEPHTWLNDASRLGFLNPAALAWELIPYSFVVDWFINIGDTLQNLDALTGVRRYMGHRTVRDENFVLTEVVPRTTDGVGGQYWRRMVTTRRSPYDDLSVPLPSWEPYMGFGRIMSALSLSRARIR